MSETNKVIDLNAFTLNMLLTSVFEWAYQHDLDLYKNLDSVFDARSRNSRNQDQCEDFQTSAIFEQYTAIDLLSRAIKLADFHDTLRFNWTFAINNNSTNKGHGSYDWKYDSHKPHPYSSLIPLIEEQTKSLRERGLADWHKSLDHGKHRHFRWWIQNLMDENKLMSMRLFVQHTGNTRCFDSFYIGSNESEAFKPILQYILDNNICPDPHHARFEVPDFVNPDNYNERYITRSGRFGGFNYLVYLTASELQELYKTKLKRSRMNYMEKAYWGYINAASTDKETKFFLFLT